MLSKSSMQQPDTKKLDFRQSSLPETNMVQDLQEIGLLSKNLLSFIIFRGPLLQGVKAVIAQSFERIHRSNLVGMGILPLQFKAGESAESLGLKGTEQYTIHTTEDIQVGEEVEVTTNTGVKFTVKSRIDTQPEVTYYKNGGILPFVLRKLVQ